VTGKVLLAACSREAATHAVMKWHYSKAMPAGKIIGYGVWDDNGFAGSVIYGRGANPRLGERYGLDQVEVCELVRVALKPRHQFPTSQAVSMSLRQIRCENPGLRLVLSYADTKEKHHGGIYQAMNWVYVGETFAQTVVLHGKRVHQRTVVSKYGTAKIEYLRKYVDPTAYRIMQEAKHKYLMPLDKQMRRRVMKDAKPYPGKVEEELGVWSFDD